MSTSPDTTAARQAFAALPPTVIAAEAPWPSPPRPPAAVTTAGIAAAASLAAWSGDDPVAVLDRHPEAGLVHCPDHGVTSAAPSSSAADNDRCGNCHGGRGPLRPLLISTPDMAPAGRPPASLLTDWSST